MVLRFHTRPGRNTPTRRASEGEPASTTGAASAVIRLTKMARMRHSPRKTVNLPFPRLRVGLVWSPTAHRRALSLIEVLVSIFVVSVGLLGIAALLPIAHYDTRQGTINDVTALVGKHGWRNVRTRGITQPRNWIYSTGSEVFNQTLGLWFADVHDPLNPYTPKAFVIDPRFVARHQGTQGTQKKYFPYTEVIPPYMAMERITLRADPLQTPGNNGQLTPMSEQLADQVFVWQNDLVFHVSSDADVIAVQQFTKNGDNNVKRQFNARYSWLATVVPVTGDLYRISVVVFHDRVLPQDLSMDNISERVVDVEFTGGGYAGGDVRLTSSEKAELEVDNGEWLMLIPPADGFAPGVAPTGINRWYRVAKTSGDPEPEDDDFVRDVVLAGPDVVNLPPDNMARAIIVDNTVAVYEKTMELEFSSGWSF